MIRLGNNIRMTQSERDTLENLVGFKANPQTVDQHDAILSRAQAQYGAPAEMHTSGDTAEDESGAAEAKLMAAVIGNMAIGANG
jgi:hypothetical protein